MLRCDIVVEFAIHSKLIINLFTILHITTIHNGSIAQLVEHNTFNVGVMGSSPVGITNQADICLGLCVSFSVIICGRNYIIAGLGPIAQRSEQ